MKKWAAILFLISAGVILSPKAGTACCCYHHTIKGMVCHKQPVSHHITNISYCNIHKEADAHSPGNSGGRGEEPCHCFFNNITAIGASGESLLLTDKKVTSQNFYCVSLLCSGYCSFWRPPKIA